MESKQLESTCRKISSRLRRSFEAGSGDLVDH